MNWIGKIYPSKLTSEKQIYDGDTLQDVRIEILDMRGNVPAGELWPGVFLTPERTNLTSRLRRGLCCRICNASLIRRSRRFSDQQSFTIAAAMTKGDLGEVIDAGISAQQRGQEINDKNENLKELHVEGGASGKDEDKGMNLADHWYFRGYLSAVFSSGVEQLSVVGCQWSVRGFCGVWCVFICYSLISGEVAQQPP